MAALLASDAALRALPESEAQQAYLSLVETLPLYGAALFPGAVADPGTAQAREVLLAVDGEGLAMHDPLDVGMKGPVSAVPLEAMGQWGFYPHAAGRGLFYYTLKDGSQEEQEDEDADADAEAVRVVNFATPDGSAICETLTGVAYAYIKNAELLGRMGKAEGEGVIGTEEEEEQEGGKGGLGK